MLFDGVLLLFWTFRNIGVTGKYTQIFVWLVGCDMRMLSVVY
jgi:hypothetical protein